jgi:hypothetical protein
VGEEARRPNATNFLPFKRYMENRELLTKHLNGTDIAYALAVCVLSDKRIKAANSSSVRKAAKKADSFTKADFAVGEPQRLYGWVTFSEYAKLEGVAVDEVEKQARSGSLGKIETHPDNRNEIVVWPKGKQGSAEIKKLRLGSSKWSVPVQRPANEIDLGFDTEDSRAIKHALRLLVSGGRALGEPTKVYSEARELTYRSTFLNLWSTFESFMRETVADLIRRFPSSLGKLPDGKKPTISYLDLIEGTRDFTTIEELRENIINVEIARVDAGDQSVTGLINLLKNIFIWETDPYKREYIEHGKRLMTGFSDVAEIRSVRNALVHRNEIRNVEGPKRLKIEDGQIVIDREYLYWAIHVLTSIAHGISEDIDAKRLKLKTIN